MASILIVEDGSNIPNANSYVDLTTFRAYALARGVTLSLVDATDDALCLKAMDYIESFRTQYQGMKTYPTQALQWPRSEIDYFDSDLGYVSSSTGIMIDCVRIDNDVIPNELKNLQMQTALAIHAGTDFANLNQEQKFVIEEKVAVIQQKYSDKDLSTRVSVDTINDMLDVLFYPCGNTNGLRTVRV